ncbi:MAG TPA: helix-turn-helix transcriptional regulator [Solirubrobacterales bacterium]|jgi:transcriptional regulator with XRE-family HTH domain|nr:helix-turn-helix transcriptional regulator [Solirubrobacterales bacterium]
MRKPHAYSPQTVEAGHLLGQQVRLGRLQRRWTVEELAERVGVNHTTMRKVERGDLTVGLGPALEAAVLVGVPLFDVDPVALAREQRDVQARLALIPSRARRPKEVDVDF